MARKGKVNTLPQPQGKHQRKGKKQLENKILHSYEEESAGFDSEELEDNDEQGYSFGVNSEDDEEIDSDEAFDEEDEKRFADWSFNASKSGKSNKDHKNLKNTKEISLNEEENSDESVNSDKLENEGSVGSSIDENELVDLDTLLDNDQPEKNESNTASTIRPPWIGNNDHATDKENLLESDASSSNDSESELTDSADNMNESDSESEMESSDSDHDDGENSDSKLDNLRNYIVSLNQKRKKDEADAESVLSSDDNDSIEEISIKKVKYDPHETNKESEYNLIGSSEKTIDITDLLDSIPMNEQLKASLKPLVSESSSISSKKLDAPLAKSIQDRLERQAAYEQTKNDLEKWKPIVADNRKSDQLIFPMNETARPVPSNNGLASSFEPRTESERKMHQALLDAGLENESALKKQEELALNKLSVEEVAERTRQLRFMRELMFREERKAKRVAKIKSKTYRKIRKNRKEKEMALIPKSEEDLENERIKSEEARALERMTQRHKNTSSWTRKMLERASHGEGTREAVNEQIRKGDELMQRIHGKEISEMDGEDVSEFSDSDYDTNEQVSTAFEKIRNEEEPKLKGVLGMKFMRDASNRQKALVQDEMQAFEDELAGVPNEDDTSQKGEDGVPGVLIGNNTGRRSFKPSEEAAKLSLSSRKNPFVSDSAVLKVNKPEMKEGQKKAEARKKKESPLEATEETNPWLQVPDQRTSSAKKLDKNSSKADKKNHKLKMDKVASLQELVEEPKVQPDLIFEEKAFESASEAESDVDVSVPMLKPTKGRLSIKQRELVAKAFAGDDVVAEFEKDKEDWVQEDAPKEEDHSLPGWGSWGGVGVKQRKTKPKVKKIAGLDPSKRKDSKLKHVIINEKRNKKAAKLTADSVPFPFESREQYERSLNLPMGPEWTTRASHHKAVAPRVVTKRGKVINPIKAPN
ncbi:U3 snoRNP protein Utp14 [Schizosaccharomyces pombe]